MCYFNSQPRKETDLPVCSRNVPIGISIHSLARRLTGSAEEDWERCYISIHSLARRLTVCRNLRMHDCKAISIHSLARRLTLTWQSQNI